MTFTGFELRTLCIMANTLTLHHRGDLYHSTIDPVEYFKFSRR
jgi:hypothetical protein